MSYCQIMHVWPEEKRIEPGREFRNAHGFLGRIWKSMMVKHRGLGADMYYLSLMESNWNMYEDRSIPLSHRAVLLMSYDNAMLRSKDYAAMVASLRQFSEDMPTPGVCHLRDIADEIEKTTSPAIGFYGHSVSENRFDPEYPRWGDYFDVYEQLAEVEATWAGT